MRTIFFILGVISSLFATAQQGGISYGFRYDTVAIRAGTTFSNSLWIENNSTAIVTLVQLHTSADISGLLNLPDSIVLQAGEKKWFPLKYFADGRTVHSNFQQFPVMLTTAQKGIMVQSRAFFIAHLQQIQGLVVDTDEPEIYLSQVSRQTSIFIRCYNNGLIPIRFHLELSNIPEGLEFTGNTTELTLAPGQQQTIVFTAINKSRGRTATDFQVMIRALDKTGTQLAIKNLRMMSMSSDKRLGLNQSSFSQSPPNTVGLRYLYVNQGLSAYQLQGNGSFFLADSQQLRYQLNADYINSPVQKGFNLYDTYIDYQSRKWGLRAGTIYELLDFNLNGRGIKARLKTGRSRSLNLYGIDNNYMLYNGVGYSPQNQGSTFALVYQDQSAPERNKTFTLLRNSNTWSQINTSLLSGTITLPISEKTYVAAEGGYSLLDIKNAGSRRGGAAGVKFVHNSRRLRVYSYNYYSTPYYGGLRRGLFQLDNNIALVLGRSNTLSATIRLLHNTPGQLSNFGNAYLSAANKYGNNTYEIGYGARIGSLNFSFRPYYFTQHIRMQAGNENWKSASLRGKLNLNYAYAAHTVFLEADNGYTFQNTSRRPQAPFLSSRINASYRGQVLGFSAFAQFNSYYLTDALALQLERPKYTFLSLGPIATFSLFQQRVSLNSGATYNYSGYNHGSNYAVNGNLRWHLKHNWTVTADVLYGVSAQSMAYNVARGSDASYDPGDPTLQYRYSSRQLRFGIEKGFHNKNRLQERKLELFFYADLNANDHYDEGEPVAPGVQVRIDGTIAITNRKGLVKFTGEKNKSYAISILNNKNWSLLKDIEMILRKNSRIEVALVKTELLTGKLVYVADKYADAPPPPAGMRVKAVSASGSMFTTLIDEQGFFHLYLPEDQYTLSVEAGALGFTMLQGNQLVQVQQQHRKTIELKYTYQGRKIEVTRFN
ncbi:COG1470 family protein [Niabella drilacis]|uniref:Carboxypeptidase regulatory-like domain-containing protein n=1 Tax=Niabella drilacis (strain DSM 25811 / CCM 8410 / CCUG 62505 / LMG 26954 / E90) TaxID=1285928 RepID=A0A1G7BT73_NIADE|nr:hypothetical protein [Niabella drilacis]SDE30197.1 hypothetical protein SAMN04487894_13312 [Niabella drilacis]